MWQFITSYGRDPARVAAKYDLGSVVRLMVTALCGAMRGVTTVKISSMPG